MLAHRICHQLLWDLQAPAGPLCLPDQSPWQIFGLAHCCARLLFQSRPASVHQIRERIGLTKLARAVLIILHLLLMHLRWRP